MPGWRLLRREGLLHLLPGRRLQVREAVQVRTGKEGRLQVPVRGRMQVRRGLQVPELHLLRPEALLHLLPGRRLQVREAVQVRTGKEGRLQVPVRGRMQVRRSLQVPELHLLRPEALLHLLPGRRLQVRQAVQV